MLHNNKLNFTKQLVLALVVAGVVLPISASAGNQDSVSCSVNVIGSAPYQKDFLVEPNVPFFDDFGTPIRFKDFRAELIDTAGITTVRIDYFADISAFNSIDFGTTLTIPNNHHDVTANGTAGFSSNSGNGVASYAVTCRRN